MSGLSHPAGVTHGAAVLLLRHRSDGAVAVPDYSDSWLLTTIWSRSSGPDGLDIAAHFVGSAMPTSGLTNKEKRMSDTQTTELTEQEPNKRKKRALLLLVGIVAASGVGTLAYGYWTESGAGTGGATAATTSALTINQVGAPTGLYPGGPAQALSGDFNNPNTSPVTLT